jgi:large subunit ribosomal protein L32e
MTEDNSPTPRRALRLRQRIKSKKPAFVRPESWRYDEFSESWRRPRGLDNKVRQKVKGWPPMPSMGYKGPKATRGLHPSGYREVIVNNVADLSTIDPATQAARIGRTVGKRKRALIIEEAKNLKIKVLNVKITAEKEPDEGAEEEAEEEKKGAKPKAEKKKEAPKKEKAKPKEKPKAKKGEKKQ